MEREGPSLRRSQSALQGDELVALTQRRRGGPGPVAPRSWATREQSTAGPLVTDSDGWWVSKCTVQRTVVMLIASLVALVLVYSVLQRISPPAVRNVEGRDEGEENGGELDAWRAKGMSLYHGGTVLDEQELLGLLGALVAVESTASHPSGRMDALHLLMGYFHDSEWSMRLLNEMTATPSLLISSKALSGMEARQHFHLLLLVHADVVEGEAFQLTWNFDLDGASHMLDDLFGQGESSAKRKLFGRGVSDMKGQVAAIAHLLRRVPPKGLDVAMLVTTDEEVGGNEGSRTVLLGLKSSEMHVTADIAIVPDAGPDNFQLVTHEKGILHARISEKGKSGHGSRPWDSVNAAELLMEDLVSIHAFLDAQPPSDAAEGDPTWRTTCAVTQLSTGDGAINTIPGAAEATVDIRFTEQWESAALLAALSDVIAGDIKAVARGEPMVSPRDSPVMQEAQRILEEELGRSVAFARGHGASDGRFLSEAGCAVVMFKQLGGGSHASEEWTDFDSLVQFYFVVRRLLREWGPIVT